MQNLSVIVTVIVAAAAIIVVLLWRLKAPPAVDVEPLNKRIQEEIEKTEAIRTKLEAIEGLLRTAEANCAAAKASETAENTRADAAELRTASLSTKHEMLLSEHKKALERAATASADIENARVQMKDMANIIEAMQVSLTEERAKLATALAKQQAGEDAAREFKLISQEILSKNLEEAKRGMEELAKSFQKSSDVELEKHADKVALTLEPLQAKLLAYDESIKRLAKDSQESHGSLTQQITELQKAERSLHDQAQALTYALSASPKVKGMYGELMLKQLVEFVGMQEKCHFVEQLGHDAGDGRRIPDLIISLPNGQKLIVDAKAVMDACVEAYQAKNEDQRNIKLKQHCANVRARVADLASKDYFLAHQDAVEMVVLFLPAENLYSAAVENDPTLTEDALKQKIIVCGPNSLMMLLKVANQLWRRASIEKEADDIKKCGDAIYKAACDFVEKFAAVGKKIQSLETEYNQAIGTFEGRLLPAGKRMNTFNSIARNKEIGELEPVKDNVREFKEATLHFAAATPRLIGTTGELETAELIVASGEKQ